MQKIKKDINLIEPEKVQRSAMKLCLKIMKIWFKTGIIRLVGYIDSDARASGYNGKNVIDIKEVSHSAIMSKLKSKELVLYNYGLFFHELFHLFYSDFSYPETLLMQIKNGLKKNEYPELTRLMTDNVHVRVHSHVESIAFHFINICEDGHIERRGKKNYPLWARAIDFVNKVIMEEAPQRLVDYPCNQTQKGFDEVSSYFTYALSIALTGKSINLEGVPEDFEKLCRRSRRSIMLAVYENGKRTRIDKALAALEEALQHLPKLDKIDEQTNSQVDQILSSKDQQSGSSRGNDSQSQPSFDVNDSKIQLKKKKKSGKPQKSDSDQENSDSEAKAKSQPAKKSEKTHNSQEDGTTADSSEQSNGQEQQKDDQDQNDAQQDNDQEQQKDGQDEEQTTQEESNEDEGSSDKQGSSESTDSESGEDAEGDLEEGDTDEDEDEGSSDKQDSSELTDSESGEDAEGDWEEGDTDADEDDFEEEINTSSKGGSGDGLEEMGDAFERDIISQLEKDLESEFEELEENKELQRQTYALQTKGKPSRYTDCVCDETYSIRVATPAESSLDAETKKTLNKYIEQTVRKVADEVKTRTEGGVIPYRLNGQLAQDRLTDYYTRQGIDRYRLFDQVTEGEDGLDICVELCIDASGSMCGSESSVIAISYILHGICTKLGIPIRIAAYTGSNIVMFEDFDSPQKNLFERRILNYDPHGGTNEGQILKTFEKSFVSRPEKYKYLFMITDGEPGPFLDEDRASQELGITNDYDSEGCWLDAEMMWLRQYQAFLKKQHGIQMVACCTGSCAGRVAQIYTGPKIIFNDYKKLAKRLTEEFLRPLKT